jgi:acyl carrier protein
VTDVETLYAKLAEILEVDQVRAGDVLSSFDTWDSLTRLSILAMLDSSYGVNLAAGDFKSMNTIEDLSAAVEARKRR